MKSKLEEAIEGFIEDRINECWANLSKSKGYKDISKKREKIFSQMEDKLPNDKDLLSEYEKAELEMYEKQIHEAYRTGVSDSVYMFIEGLKKEYGKLSIDKFVNE